MHCQHLTLDEFRNYLHLSLDLGFAGVTVVQGTTLRAKPLCSKRSICSPPLALRAPSDLELINFAAPNDLGSPPFARMTAHVERPRGPLAVEILVVRDEGAGRAGRVGGFGAGAQAHQGERGGQAGDRPCGPDERGPLYARGRRPGYGRPRCVAVTWTSPSLRWTTATSASWRTT